MKNNEIRTSVLKASRIYGRGKYFETAFLAKLEDNKIIGFAKPLTSLKQNKWYTTIYDASKLPDGLYVLKSLGHLSLWEIKNGEAILKDENYKMEYKKQK